MVADFRRPIVGSLIFLVPLTIIVADEIASASFFLLVIAGIVFMFSKEGRHEIKTIATWEKILLTIFIGYVGVALLSYFFGDMSEFGLKKLGRYGRFLLAVPFYLLLRNMRPNLGFFLYGVAVGAIVAAVVAMDQIWWHLTATAVTRASGSVNSIPFGQYSLLMAVITAASLGYFFHRGRWSKLLAVCAVIFGMLASALSGTVGAWIALPLIVIAWYWLSISSISRSIRNTVVVLAMMLPIALAFIVQYKNDASITQRSRQAAAEIFQLIKTGDYNPVTSVGARIELWKAAWSAFKTAPVLGIGVGGFQTFARSLVESGQRAETASAHNHAHNEYFMALAERGIIGFTALLLVFLVPAYFFLTTVKSTSKDACQAGIVGVLSVIAFMHFAMTEAIFDRTLPITFYIFIVMTLTACGSANSSLNSGTSPRRAARRYSSS